jgi:predicted Zn-dependent peptidase
VLKSGIRVRLDQRRGTSLEGVAFSVAVGQADNPRGKRGMAHLAEHLVTEGTAQRINFERLSAQGAFMNASTSLDRTTFGTVIDAARLENVLWSEAYRIANASTIFTPEEVEREKRVIYHEWIMRRGDAYNGRVNREVFEEAFPPGDPRRGVSDLPSEFGTITVEEERAFVAKHYRPQRITLALAGDFELDSAEGW